MVELYLLILKESFLVIKMLCNEDLFLNNVKMTNKVKLTNNLTKETYLANYKI